MIESLTKLNVGDKVYFLQSNPDTFIVQAKKENYIVATSHEVEEGIQYTIIDTDKGMCGPHDRTFNFYDFNKKESMEELIDHLIQKRKGITLSRRHSAPVSLVLNLPKTTQQFVK
ncbi:hypothetical protein V1503_24780 [Bacillus sp. SCS-151]|uniref:hypothetical protein n=1 Tax=Nanhaiella sioensis TaxID=3115293 RepID=UPI00397D5D5F